jgi:hypothetical protein
MLRRCRTNFFASNPATVQIAGSSNSIHGWWNKAWRGKMDEQKKKEISLASYIIWHIWKERGRHIF